MSFSTIVARVDNDDKRNFNYFCDSVGLNASVAINLFIKTVLRENRIPFNISGKSETSRNFSEDREETKHALQN